MFSFILLINNIHCLTYHCKIIDINKSVVNDIVKLDEIFTVTMENAPKHMCNNKIRNSPHNGILIASSKAAMNLKN
jgi:hypothetical protein